MKPLDAIVCPQFIHINTADKLYGVIGMNWPGNWLFGAPKPNNHSHNQKTRQIDYLKHAFPDIKENIKEQEYLVPLHLAQSPQIALNIYLPSDYPSEKPIIKVEPAVRHPWVNDNMIVTNSPAINKYNFHSELLFIVREILNEFKTNPPISLLPERSVLSDVSISSNLPYSLTPYNKGYGYYPSLTNEQNWNNFNQQSLSTYYNDNTNKNDNNSETLQTYPTISLPSLNTTIAKTYTMPEIPDAFPKLSDFTLEQLKELNDNEGKLVDEVISKLPQIEKLTKDREKLLQNIENLARMNLSKKSDMENKKMNLLTKIDAINAKKEELNSVISNLKEISERYEPSSLCLNLKVAASQAEEESEAIFDSFIEGKLETEEFVQKFLDKRQFFHLRRIKEEKLQSMSTNR